MTSVESAMAFRSRLAENLTRLREQAGISQEELGVRASLHRTEISELERGIRIPRADTLVKLAGSLSMTPNDLLEGLNWTPGAVKSGRFRLGQSRSKEANGTIPRKGAD